MANERTKTARGNPRTEARRRWGRVRVLSGGKAPRSRGARRLRGPRLPGTAAERRVIERVLDRKLEPSEMAEAVKLLRAGAHLKELEINERIEAILRQHPDPE